MTTVCLTFDFDGFGVWMSSFKQTTPTPLSRGEYGANVGVPRILEILKQRQVKATFFVPAHTARSLPDKVRSIVAAGHEIGAHGLVHESPVGLSAEEERRFLTESLDVLSQVTGVRPVGYRSPAWDLSENTISILEQFGLVYDSSLMSGDYAPFYARKNDRNSEAGYEFGEDSRVLEFPVAWELDDYPYFHFASRPINQGLRLTTDVESLWMGEFDGAHAEGGVFTLTCHPEIIGRAPRVRMLDRLIAYMQATEGVAFKTMAEAATEYRKK